MKHLNGKTKLAKISHITMGQSPSSETYNDSKGLPFFQGNADFGRIYPRIRMYCTQPTKFAKIDDILISVRAPIGAVNISNCECCIGRGLASVRAIENISINKYIYYLLLSANEKLNRQGTGSTFKAISKDVLHKLECYDYSISTQQQIVSELDALSDIITKKKQQLEELDKLAQATFYDMFGDPVSNEKGWEMKRVEDVCAKITDGEHLTPQRESNGIYLLSARNILNHSLKLVDVDFIGEKEYIRISKRIQPKEGDILISCSGSVGRVCRVPENIKFQLVRSVAILQLLTTVSTIFLEYQLCTDFVQDQIKMSINQSSQANLFQGKIKALKIVLPPLPIQSRFSNKIKVIEKQKSLINKSIEAVQQLFDYTMNKYFN